ncbi:MAG: flavin reductase [Chloroflexi bacterium]|nr:flavin reductase [Chloroflexota bacterium]
MNFKEIKVSEFNKNPFELIGQEWMLITAAKPDGVINTMTASWGTMGVMWGKNIIGCVIKPQRYTKEFVDSATTFSLSFFPRKFQDKLIYLGDVSGRDEDKIAKVNLTPAYDGQTPYFNEANLVFICQKIFAQDIIPQSFIDKTIGNWYPKSDYHTMYIGEIIKILHEIKI